LVDHCPTKGFTTFVAATRRRTTSPQTYNPYLTTHPHQDENGSVYKHTYFLANSPSATLEFRSTTGSGFGPVIDAVRVESCLLIICVGCPADC
jgi:hypothetical protein